MHAFQVHNLNLQNFLKSGKMKSDMDIGSKATIEIEDLTSTGEGVGRIESSLENDKNLVIFIPGAIPGEKIICRITEMQKKFGRGELIEIAKPSPYRIDPPCPFYTECIGCTLQHISYEGQVIFKKNRVERLFKKMSGENLQIDSFVESPRQFGYRTHISVTCMIENGLPVIGFVYPPTRKVIDISSCMLIPDWANEDMHRLRENIFANRKSITGRIGFRLFFDHRNKTTYIVYPRHDHYKFFKFDLGVFTQGFSEPRMFEDEINGVRLLFHPECFIQANYFLTPSFYAKALSELNAGADDKLVDLYAGNGYYSLALLGKIKNAYAVESDKIDCKNIKRSHNEASEKKSTESAGKKPAPKFSVICGDARTEGVKIIDSVSPTLIIANPPRTGIHSDLLETINRCDSIRRIVLVSCDPSTCTRDINLLVKGGFEAEPLTIFDCYPQTPHVETVVALFRK
ncbi:MAG: TRAM domain-containing protein [bacterium]